MEAFVTKESEKALAKNENVDTVENFQKCIYELFEKKGIMNDLRAYLRGHIVNVLRNAKTGDTPPSQKLFTQRLELNIQALNMLIVEYLIRSDFSYSLSVFVSEIPLANMVFGFSKTLMQHPEHDLTELRFADSDIWAILNYLGLQCDSEHALQIAEMYKNDKNTSLLMCILKSMPLYVRELHKMEQAMSSKHEMSIKSSNSLINMDQSVIESCNHITFCVSCQSRILKYKDEFKKKKKQNTQSVARPLTSEDLVKNINSLERSLIEEIFQELKLVYESEMGMMKLEGENKLKSYVTHHMLLLQKKKEELEDRYKAREAELETKMTQKKKFLWRLASSLRDQHQHLAKAMRDVKDETQRLYSKEESLKTQLLEAEQILKKHGMELREQITEELAILDSHLNSMKRERESINKERNELENLKNIQNNSKVNKIPNIGNEELHSHYDLLKNELNILKKYLESSKLAPKGVMERGTMTESIDISSNCSLNNTQTLERNKNDDDKLKNQVVNDFKKKNVNHSPLNLECPYSSAVPVSDACRSPGSSQGGDGAGGEAREHLALHRLRHENYRLKACAKQQKCHIEALSRACALLPRAGPAAAPHSSRTPTLAPPPVQPALLLQNLNTSGSTNVHATMSVGWRKGAGEELSMFGDAQPRIFVPGDEIPFVGVLRGARHTSRRQLLSQWRVLRSRTPRVCVKKRAHSPHNNRVEPAPVEPPAQTANYLRDRNRIKPVNINREKSPNSVLREAKQNLRNIKDSPVAVCEKSPSSMLREAKQRLRKLEIEAEAVEKSYLDYRRRRSEQRLDRNAKIIDNDTSRPADVIGHLELNRSRSKHKPEDTNKNGGDVPLTTAQKSIHDLDKYLREYKKDLNTNTPLRNHITEDTHQTERKIYSKNDNHKVKDYLETPLTEFRKLYHCDRHIENEEHVNLIMFENPSNVSELSGQGTVEPDASIPVSLTKELTEPINIDTSSPDILKHDTNKIDSLCLNQTEVEVPILEQNVLRLEVETVSEVTIKAASQDLSVVIQNSIDIQDTVVSPHKSQGNSGQITVIVSPRNSVQRNDANISLDRSEPISSNPSPEKEAHLTLDAIFQGNNETKLVDNKETPTKDTPDGSIEDDYADNFSADVDNYNIRTESDSPISLIKTSLDDMLWDNM